MANTNVVTGVDIEYVRATYTEDKKYLTIRRVLASPKKRAIRDINNALNGINNYSDTTGSIWQL